jgi:predicted component of type VI protein secretion system
MAQESDIKKMADRILALRQEAAELKGMSGGIQAIDRNVDRILANVRMLELNISDVLDVI